MDNVQLKTLEAVNNSKRPVGDWSSKPAAPATTVPVTNNAGHGMFVEINGGTVTVVKLDNVQVGATARTSGLFYVRPGGTISMTYSVAPTWQWFAA